MKPEEIRQLAIGHNAYGHPDDKKASYSNTILREMAAQLAELNELARTFLQSRQENSERIATLTSERDEAIATQEQMAVIVAELKDNLRQMTECRDDLNRLVEVKDAENATLRERLAEMEKPANPGLRIVRLGLGEVVSNWGMYGDKPAVFIEPVLGEAGKVGDYLPEGREPQIQKNSVTTDAIVIEIHDVQGAKVLIEDIQKAVWSYDEAHPEALRCGDCVLIHGKSVCTMNCGPSVESARAQKGGA